MTGDPSEVDPQFVAQVDALGLGVTGPEVQESGLGEEYDRFVASYDHLPEVPMISVLGGDIVVEYVAGKPMCLRPIAQYGGRLVVRDLAETEPGQFGPAYRILYGSLYFAEGAEEKHSQEVLANTAFSLIRQGNPMVGRTIDNEVLVAYNPFTFCRGAELVGGPAYPIDQLNDKRMRTLTAMRPLVGSVITVQPEINRPLTLFMADDFHRSPRIQTVRHRVGDNYHSLLSYV